MITLVRRYSRRDPSANPLHGPPAAGLPPPAEWNIPSDTANPARLLFRLFLSVNPTNNLGMRSQQSRPGTGSSEVFTGSKLSQSSPSKMKKLRAGSNTATAPEAFGPGAKQLSRDTEVIQSPASGDSFSRMVSRGGSGPGNTFVVPAPPGETSVLHQHLQDMANKRISTLDYLRKA
jgi:hypothetical protein